MQRYLILIYLQIFALTAFSQTPTYHELIDSYRQLTGAFPETTKLREYGKTDSGNPLHLFIIDKSGSFDPDKLHAEGRLVCLIMNGIHPGEACGINASLSFAAKQASNPSENVVYCIIPVYNVGGALNRNSHSRANQDGPLEYGFRGNAKNLDLNRDFIKADAQNTFAFYKIFHTWKPQVFVDTHTSNGADYAYNMTLLSTMPERLEAMQGKYLQLNFLPKLYEGMEALGDPMVPYVNVFGKSPEFGYNAFTDLPRYSTGYVALFNTIGFTTEAHMLKPFEQRVKSTENFLSVLNDYLNLQYKTLISLKSAADKATTGIKTVPYSWKVDESADSILFKGYTVDTVDSEVTGGKRIVFLRNQPYEKNIPYRAKHVAQEKTALPEYYVLPQAFTEVIQRLDENRIEYRRLENDTTIEVLADYIADFETVNYPYEGHYLHYNTTSRESRLSTNFYKGDLIIPTNQLGNKYLALVFSPQSEDSFFNWNFFDANLGQKEYYSAYVFEDTATELLRRDKNLRKAFEEKKANDQDFANSPGAQLDFIYKQSKHYEGTHMRIPVYRILPN